MKITRKARLDFGLCAILTVLAYMLWVSSDSFWIDEGNAATKAVQGSISAWYDALVKGGGSDAQMPGFMLYGWLWEKVFGSGELVLRAGNLPWYFLALWSMRYNRMELLVLALSPFVLYYLNEFRPYMMQIAGGAMVISGLRLVNQNLATAWRKVLCGCLILCASSLIGVLWAAGGLVSTVILRPDILRVKSVWRDSAVVSLVFIGLGCYYVKSLLMGQGAAALSGGILMSVGACVYELMGLLGLGPSRVELRVNAASVGVFVVPLIAGASFTSVTWGMGLVGLWKVKSLKDWQALLAALAIPLGALVVLLFLKDFRLLARHIAPLSVLLAILTGHVLTGCGWVGNWKRIAQVSAAAAVAIGVISALSTRFCVRHRKDDYRQAAQIARTAIANGHPVVWAADSVTGTYYGLQFEEESISTGCRLWDKNKPMLAGEETVIFSKPDINDPKGDLRAALNSGGFAIVDEIPAFSIWQVPDRGRHRK